MALARWQRTIVDDDGNVLTSGTVSVYNEVTGALAPLKSDRAGTTGVLNPITIPADGFVAFYVRGGAYRIVATQGLLTREWRHVPIGTAQEYDVEDLAGGFFASRIVTAAGDVEVGTTDILLIVKKTVGAATSVNLPAAATRGTTPVIIKDGKGDADVNPITPVFDGAEVCDGLAGTEFQITTPYGWVRFDPLPDGTGWIQLGGQL